MSHQEAPSYPVWSGLKNSVNAEGLPPLGNDFERVQGVVDREKEKKLIDALCHLRSGNNQGWGQGQVGNIPWLWWPSSNCCMPPTSSTGFYP